MKRLIAIAIFVLASCTPEPTYTPPSRAAATLQTAGPMKSFPPSRVLPLSRSNADMAQDFLDLSFQMESGKAIPRLTRFEGPITVGVAGPISQQLLVDLDGLLSRMRSEAGLNIQFTTASNPSIVIEAVPQAELQRAVPRAACFVVPRISGWADFLRSRSTDKVDWTTLERRERAVIFVPSNAPAQEIRDCLHEELAQAIGPLNDLYRLPDSVFNDDNIHAVLTGFDMLMLRVYYAPELASGMSRDEVAAQLPSLFARFNPAGQAVAPEPGRSITREWNKAIETALSSSPAPDQRRNAAAQAISIARTLGWGDVREGFSYYAFGRLQINNAPDQAAQAFAAAETIYASRSETQIHAAHITLQLSAFALAQGDVARVIDLADRAIPVARHHQNAALMSTLMMFKAEALEMRGQSDAARALRLDSLGWARYGFGLESQVTARFEEIRALRPF